MFKAGESYQIVDDNRAMVWVTLVEQDEYGTWTVEDENGIIHYEISEDDFW